MAALSIALARLLARRDEAAAAVHRREVDLNTCLKALKKPPLNRNEEGVRPRRWCCSWLHVR